MRSPARKAPRAMDRPAICVRRDVPMHVRRVVAAKISALATSAIFRNMGRRTALPTEMMTVMQTTALMAARPSAEAMSPRPTDAPPVFGASSGMSISRATTARSWRRSTAKVARPCRLPFSPRSLSTCRATAVEESAREPPTITAAGPCSPSSMLEMAITAVLPKYCAAPRPKTYLIWFRSLSRLSSRPMLKRRNTTPNSATYCTAWTSWMRPRALGPMRAPPARKPSTALPPGSFITSGTEMTLVQSRTSMSITPRSMWRPSGTNLSATSAALRGRSASCAARAVTGARQASAAWENTAAKKLRCTSPARRSTASTPVRMAKRFL
mmetsp:Transcript_19394/g.46247  ORF Transcript_19394/g.46247 Transcript_19394/m.46247 type:complete len:326 (+) Transcript_19394:952-1929(+)